MNKRRLTRIFGIARGIASAAGADSSAPGLVGGRIVPIGGAPMDEAAENERAAREQIARILPRAGFLAAAGLAGAQESSIRIEVELSRRRLSRELAFAHRERPDLAGRDPLAEAALTFGR